MYFGCKNVCMTCNVICSARTAEDDDDDDADTPILIRQGKFTVSQGYTRYMCSFNSGNTGSQNDAERKSFSPSLSLSNTHLPTESYIKNCALFTHIVYLKIKKTQV